MNNNRIYWLHALSPTHAGIGRGVGDIDLPIDRDGVTNWPIIRASGFKGVWADHFRATPDARKEDPMLRHAFGMAGENNDSNAGALIPTDAQLVCLPVRSYRGTFAWATSPLCLRRLHRMLEQAGAKDLPNAPSELPETDAHYCGVEGQPSAITNGERIYLEDLDFNAKQCSTKWAKQLGGWVFTSDSAWNIEFQKRFVVLPDDAFNFLCETGTEVHTRVRIDNDTKTVIDGALWTEESLPAETILAGIIACDRVFAKNGTETKSGDLIEKFAKQSLALQIGGKASVGRGQMRCVFSEVR